MHGECAADTATESLDIREGHLQLIGEYVGAVVAQHQLPSGRAREVGRSLFAATFHDSMRRLIDDARRAGPDDRERLRICLDLSETPELAELPWELLCDDDDQFLAASTWTPVVRLVPRARMLRPPVIDLPIRLLGVVSDPITSGSGRLSATVEQEKIALAFAPLVAAGKARLPEWADDGRLSTLVNTIEGFHILHFIGHGSFTDGVGSLTFTAEGGLKDAVDGDRLADVLADNSDVLRLVVLNACDSGRTSEQGFSGVAHELLRRGFPAVVAMQTKMPDEAATVFAAALYEAITDAQPIDSAMSIARKKMRSVGYGTEWAIPILFVGSESELFDINEESFLPSKDRYDALKSRNDGYSQLVNAVRAAVNQTQLKEEASFNVMTNEDRRERQLGRARTYEVKLALFDAWHEVNGRARDDALDQLRSHLDVERMSFGGCAQALIDLLSSAPEEVAEQAQDAAERATLRANSSAIDSFFDRFGLRAAAATQREAIAVLLNESAEETAERIAHKFEH